VLQVTFLGPAYLLYPSTAQPIVVHNVPACLLLLLLLLQVTFLGPAYLLYLLQPKLAACSTQLLFTASPLHRLGRIDDMPALLLLLLPLHP
jgi:hypothetical protein